MNLFCELTKRVFWYLYAGFAALLVMYTAKGFNYTGQTLFSWTAWSDGHHFFWVTYLWILVMLLVVTPFMRRITVLWYFMVSLSLGLFLSLIGKLFIIIIWPSIMAENPEYYSSYFYSIFGTAFSVGLFCLVFQVRKSTK